MNSYFKLCTEFYNIDKPAANPKALAFLLDYARRFPGPILEPMCGSGRYLLALAAEGFDIEGVDASLHMLAALDDGAKARGITPRAYHQLLHEMDLERRYGLVLMQDASFSLITDLDQAKEALRRIRRHLVHGGTLVIGAQIGKGAESHSWPWGGRWVTRPDGAMILLSWLGHYDATDGVSRSLGRYELIRDGKLVETEIESFDLRAYDIPDFIRMLEEAGFVDVKPLKAHEQRPPDEGDDEVLFEALAG